MILANVPVCRQCGCLYPAEYSKHPDYCDDCFKNLYPGMNDFLPKIEDK